MTAQRWALAAVLAVVAAGVVVLVVVTGERPDAPPLRPPASPAAADRARAACQAVQDVQRMVADNASADAVFARIDAARTEAAAAARDQQWLSLRSGVESVARGLRDDDAAMSELGIAIARHQCRLAGVYLEGSVR